MAREVGRAVARALGAELHDLGDALRPEGIRKNNATPTHPAEHRAQGDVRGREPGLDRRSIIVTSNMVFSQWEEIFQNPMATAAAIDRIVHHSVITEFDVPSYRTAEATARQASRGPHGGGSRRPNSEKKTQQAPGARTRRKTGAK